MSKYDLIPVSLCLQELQVSNSYNLNNNLYTLISKVPHIHIGYRPHGGSGILIRKDVPYGVISLNSSLQAVACCVFIPNL